jgi:hypothetical protein
VFGTGRACGDQNTSNHAPDAPMSRERSSVSSWADLRFYDISIGTISQRKLIEPA